MIENDKPARLPIDRILRREETSSETGVPTAQERFSDEELASIRREFAKRLQEVFRGLKQRDIARKLQTTDTTVRPYLDGTRLPVPEMLLQIHRVTGVSLDWLLMGKGAKFVEAEKIFTSQEIAEIEEMASESGRTFAEELRRLVTSGRAAVKSYRS